MAENQTSSQPQPQSQPPLQSQSPGSAAYTNEAPTDEIEKNTRTVFRIAVILVLIDLFTLGLILRGASAGVGILFFGPFAKKFKIRPSTKKAIALILAGSFSLVLRSIIQFLES